MWQRCVPFSLFALYIKETLITFVCALPGAFLRPTASMSLNAATAVSEAVATEPDPGVITVNANVDLEFALE